jgi:hypothetical protein
VLGLLLDGLMDDFIEEDKHVQVGEVVLADFLPGHNPDQLQNAVLGSDPYELLLDITFHGEHNTIRQQWEIGILVITEEFKQGTLGRLSLQLGD